jgi:hypothetical protein
MMDHSFTLQAIMDLKGAVDSVGTKIDRLIGDVSNRGDKIDAVQHQLSSVKDAVWVIGGLLAAIAATSIYIRIAGW